MGAKASHHLDANGDMIELFFLKAGKMRYLKQGERIIQEGQAVQSVFLVTEGELILKKKKGGGQRGDKVIGSSRFKGSLLGELSLLLGQPVCVGLPYQLANKIHVCNFLLAFGCWGFPAPCSRQS